MIGIDRQDQILAADQAVIGKAVDGFDLADIFISTHGTKFMLIRQIPESISRLDLYGLIGFDQIFIGFYFMGALC